MANQGAELSNFFSRNAMLGQTERYRKAAVAEAYYLGTQYDDKRDWFDKSYPLRQRKPRINVPLFRKIVEQVDRFLWAGHRTPRVVINATRDAEDPSTADDIGPALEADDAEKLTEFVSRLIDKGGLFKAAREFTTKSLITTSACVIVGVQDGQVSAYVHSGKDCTPVFSPTNHRKLLSVEVKYQFLKDEVEFGIPKQSWYWYRRVINEQRDVVFIEERVVGNREPDWQEDPDRTVEHGLGFCPALWVRTFPDCDDLVDGKPLIDPSLYPAFDAVSYTVSQKQRAVEYGTDPQPWRKGVPEAERPELEKNPGKIWDLPGDTEHAKVAVGFLEVQGSGVEKAASHLNDLFEMIRQVVGIVDSSPDLNAGSASGVALELLYAPMISLASDLRVDLGDEAYCKLVGLTLRIICSVVSRGEDVWIPGVKRAVEILTKAQTEKIWLDPPICLEWQPFFNESEMDKASRVTYTAAAVSAGLVTKSTAVRHLASTFTVANPAQEVEALEKESAEVVAAPPKEMSQETADEKINA